MMKINPITNILKTLETSSSLGLFTRDTGGCLLSRLSLSRSKDESREISISELSESALFYFGAPMLAKKGANLFSKIYKLNKDEFSSDIKSLNNISCENLKKIKLGKFGQILSVFGIILPIVFSIAPVRNNITLSKTGKKDFLSVINLKNGENSNKKAEEGKKKSINLLKRQEHFLPLL